MNELSPLPRLAALWLALLAICVLSLVGCGSGGVLALGDDASLDLVDVADENLIEEIIPQMNNHDDAEGPLYIGKYAGDQPRGGADFIVVTYNLRYGEAVEEAIRAYQEANPLPDADIILLQEMDEVGVRAVASELGYNFVYYPASVAEDGDNFGNAILSRWPISDPAKLILPGLHPLTGQQRTATRAIVHVGETEVLAYSTHIEVATAPPSMRAAQIAAILDDIPSYATHVVVGGDFNTVTSRGVEALANQFDALSLVHDSAGLGPTFTRFGVRPSATDHLFTRGFQRVDAGVLGHITASDHFPVWARFNHP